MYPSHGRDRYTVDAIRTASPAKLLTMLYDRLVRDLVQAESAQRAGDRHTANTALLHAQDIVLELRSSLRLEVWDGAPRLAAIYTFLLSELVAANVAGDADRTAACTALVEPLRSAWHEAAASLPGLTAGAAGAAGTTGTVGAAGTGGATRVAAAV